eukprot:110111-Pelagomonas_calceolata.AAC.5
MGLRSAVPLLLKLLVSPVAYSDSPGEVMTHVDMQLVQASLDWELRITAPPSSCSAAAVQKGSLSSHVGELQTNSKTNARHSLLSNLCCRKGQSNREHEQDYTPNATRPMHTLWCT